MEIHSSRIVTNRSLKPINPVMCGYQKCGPSHFFGPATRDYWLLHYVISGKGKFSTKRATVQLSEGNIFIIRPYEITYYEADAEAPWEYIWIGFTSEIPLPATLTSNDTLYAPFLKNPFTDAYENSYFRFSDPSGGYEYFLCGIIWQIFGLCIKDSGKSTETSENYVKQAISTIETEYQSGLTVSGLAARLHLNRSYFSVIFKEATGISPQKYLTNHRMNRAAELLTKRSFNVTVTAISVGYPDVFCFSRAFKRHFSCSPSEYSEKYRSKMH